MTYAQCNARHPRDLQAMVKSEDAAWAAGMQRLLHRAR